MPRATTAACEVRPPRVVRMPAALCMPAMSSGDVSMRTRMTGSSFAICDGALGVEGDAPRRRAGAGGQAAAEDAAAAERLRFLLRVEHRREELHDLPGLDARRPPRVA